MENVLLLEELLREVLLNVMLLLGSPSDVWATGCPRCNSESVYAFTPEFDVK